MKQEIRIEALAPKAPPCFSTRCQWLSYLQGAAELAAKGAKPVVIKAGAPQFNTEFRFCCDCTKEKRELEKARGRCHPAWLKTLAKEMP